MPKIERLPGVDLSPTALFAQLLEAAQAGGIKMAAVVVTMEDGSIYVSNSAMNFSDLALFALAMQDRALSLMKGEHDA